MPEEKRIAVDREAEAFFQNHVDFCIGTGRMGLALTQEYQDQLNWCRRRSDFSISGGMACSVMIWRYIMNMRRTVSERQSTIIHIWIG